MVDRYCKGCFFYALYPALGYGCEYILITDKRRPCPSGEGCTARIIADSKVIRKGGDRRELYMTQVQKQPRKGSGPPRKIARETVVGAHNRKMLTRDNTRAYWQGRQAKAIRGWMKQEGKGYEEMARMLGVTKGTVQKWAYEANTADWEKLAALGIQRPD